MSDSTDSELEIVNPSPVRAHTKYSVAQKTKEKRKREHSSSIDAETRAKQPQNADFYAEKGKLFCKFCSIRMDHSRQSVLSAHCLGDTHKKQKERTAQTGQIQSSLFTTLPVPNEARLDNLILISDWVRACAGSKLSLNAASSPLMRKFLSKHIPSGGSIPQRDGLSLYLKDCYKSDKEKLKSFKNKKVMVFYDETTDSAARNVCVIAISVVPPAGTDIQPHLAEIIFEKLKQGGPRTSNA